MNSTNKVIELVKEIGMTKVLKELVKFVHDANSDQELYLTTLEYDLMKALINYNKRNENES